MKYNDNGEYKDIYVKSFDTLPVGTEVDYDGETVPTGWTETTPIIESGSNANGNWIKYNDGTMICYGVYTNTLNITSLYEDIYYANTGTITFPVEFNAIPLLYSQTNLAGGGFTFYGNYTKTSFTGYVWKIQSASNYNTRVHWLAIGKWK